MLKKEKKKSNMRGSRIGNAKAISDNGIACPFPLDKIQFDDDHGILTFISSAYVTTARSILYRIDDIEIRDSPVY